MSTKFDFVFCKKDPKSQNAIALIKADNGGIVRFLKIWVEPDTSQFVVTANNFSANELCLVDISPAELIWMIAKSDAKYNLRIIKQIEDINIFNAEHRYVDVDVDVDECDDEDDDRWCESRRLELNSSLSQISLAEQEVAAYDMSIPSDKIPEAFDVEPFPEGAMINWLEADLQKKDNFFNF